MSVRLHSRAARALGNTNANSYSTISICLVLKCVPTLLSSICWHSLLVVELRDIKVCDPASPAQNAGNRRWSLRTPEEGSLESLRFVVGVSEIVLQYP
jgi:hypothetical protein